MNNDKRYLSELLPKRLSEDELKPIVEVVLKELNATSKRDIGRVMKEVMARTKGSADGKIVSKLVASILV